MEFDAPGASGFFFLHDERGDDNFNGYRMDRTAALAAVSAPGVRPLVEMGVSGPDMAVVWAAEYPALPRLLDVNDREISFTYDTWWWDDGSYEVGDEIIVTSFLVELVGDHEAFQADDSYDDATAAIFSNTGSDGGQRIYVRPADGADLDGIIQKIKVWRLPSGEVPKFWTNLVGTTEAT